MKVRAENKHFLTCPICSDNVHFKIPWFDCLVAVELQKWVKMHKIQPKF